MVFPRLLRIRQNFPDRGLRDVAGAVRTELSRSGFADRLRPGASIAIGVGSRGIANIAEIVRAVVDYWKQARMKPFLFPAMGSHGGGTAGGQRDVLAHYGITEATMGCEIRSQVDVVEAGTTPEGIHTIVDRLAFASDGILLVNRVKWHTDFAGEIESGLFKMMAIGLGKPAGAHRYHAHASRLGLERVIVAVGRHILGSGKILGGLAIVEDAGHHAARIRAAPATMMEKEEKKLLALAKSWMGRLPVSEVDVLIVDEAGKDISGTGMDTKVVNRDIYAGYNPWPDTPVIRRIFLRRLSQGTHGNALGLGMVDVAPDSLVASIDPESTSVNALASSSLAMARTPLHFPSERECLEKVATTVGNVNGRETTYAWIRNTLELSNLLVSENLAGQVDAHPPAEVVGGPVTFECDDDGTLPELFG